MVTPGMETPKVKLCDTCCRTGDISVAELGLDSQRCDLVDQSQTSLLIFCRTGATATPVSFTAPTKRGEVTMGAVVRRTHSTHLNKDMTNAMSMPVIAGNG